MKSEYLIDKTVTIVAVLSAENWLEQLLIINTNISNCGYEAIEVVLFNAPENIPAKFIHPLCTLSTQFCVDMHSNQILNTYMPNFVSDFLVVLSPNLYLPNNWLLESVFEFTQFDKLGLWIIQNTQKFVVTNALDKNDNLIQVCVPEYFSEYGTIVLSKNAIENIGAFNDELFSHFWITDYSDRLSKIGLITLCSSHQSTAILLTYFDNYYQSTIEEFQVNKSNYTYKPFVGNVNELGASQELAEIFASENKLQLLKYSSSVGIVFLCTILSSNQIKSISDFAQKHNLIFNIRTSPKGVLVVFS